MAPQPDHLPPRRVYRTLFVVALALSVALPGALFAWVAWNRADDARAAAEDTARRTVAVLREHALRTFEIAEVLAIQTAERLAGRDSASLESDPGLHRQLAGLVGSVDSVTAIAVVDANAVVRASSREPQPPNISLADREYIRALQSGEDVFIGRQVVGRVSNERLITLGRRRSTADGNFDGAILVGIPLAHFTVFWEQFTPTLAHVIPMIREDGELLVRHAGEEPRRLAPDGPFMRQIQRASEGLYTAVSNVDGVERLNAYAKVGDYPVYVSFSVETGAVAQSWRGELAPYAWFTAMAILALLATSLTLLRFTRHGWVSAERWRRTANRLQQEMDRRQAAEERLRQAQKMEIVGRITGGVAHDFNNLLQVLSNNLTLAERTANEDAARPFLRAAFQTVERAGGLTRQLLAFSRRQPLDPRPLDALELVHAMSGMLRTTLGTSVRLHLEGEPQTWPAMVDRHEAEMAILNLAVNARDAMPEGGTLTIRVANHSARSPDRRVPDLEPGDYVAISVADTGTGMAPEILRRAIDPFFTTKDVGKGSGLGLSQVHGFAAQSGGSVAIRSRPGSGTTVTLYLPRATEGALLSAGRPPAGDPAGTHAGTVLLVDDDDAVRNGIATNLGELGYRVLQAADGVTALERLDDGDIDILVTDYAMPGMTGAELIRRARRKPQAVRTLLITGYADLPPEERADMELLHKPFRSEELAERIATVLGANTH